MCVLTLILYGCSIFLLEFTGFTIDSAFSFMNTEPIRVFQWNALSQALGTGNDNFVKCPSSALEWRTRRFRMLGKVF